MSEKLLKLKSLYAELDKFQASGEDVVADVRAEINNLELQYLKESVLPRISKQLGSYLADLRCSIDLSIQFDGEKTLDYSVCTSGSTMLIRDKVECVSEAMSITSSGESSSLVSAKSEKACEPVTSDWSADYPGRLSSSPGISSIPNPKKDERIDKVDKWIDLILSMRCMSNKGYISPHKAIFLLTIIESIRCNRIRDNKIFLTKWLEETFRLLWNKYVPKDWPFTMII